MSVTGIFGLVLVVIIAISLLGPRKLPQGLEQLLLLLTNLRMSNTGLPALTMEQARRSWQSNGSILYAVVQILYAAEEHLLEIRRRIFYIVLALLVSAGLAAFFLNPLLEILKRPAAAIPFQFLHPTDMIWVYMEVIFSAAAVITIPVVLIQVLQFIRPALETTTEIATYKAFVVFGFPLVLLFFLGGAAFAYFLMLPFGLQFLGGTGGDVANPNWNIREYFGFVLSVIMWIGLAFETPLVMGLLGRLGVVSPQAMLRQWRIAVVAIAVVAAIITPTVDPINMGLVMGPLLALYFLGVLLARILYKPRAAGAAQAVQP